MQLQYVLCVQNRNRISSEQVGTGLVHHLHISHSVYRVLTMDCRLALFPGLPNVQF